MKVVFLFVIATYMLPGCGQGDNRGDKGKKGDKTLIYEKQGEQGEQGPEGTPGENGRDGLNGEAGPRGNNGADGKDGRPGTPGRDGIDGKDGRDGKDAGLAKSLLCQADTTVGGCSYRIIYSINSRNNGDLIVRSCEGRSGEVNETNCARGHYAESIYQIGAANYGFATIKGRLYTASLAGVSTARFIGNNEELLVGCSGTL